MPLFDVQPDGSVLGPGGKILYFSIERFVNDICKGNNCFICGASPDDVPFNDEHILPQWILRRYNLHSKSITLGNGTTYRYDQYTIPCCTECNDFMGEEFEIEISRLIDEGFQAVIDHFKQKGGWLFFVWLSLIFLKTHLKDNFLRMFRDRRAEDTKLGDMTEWETMHHIHCVARSFYTCCDLDKEVMGSLYVLPAQINEGTEDFDYADFNPGRTILLRLGNIAFIAVLTDYCAAINFYHKTFERITGPLSSLQLREIMANCAYINLLLKESADFQSDFSQKDYRYTIKAEIPENPELFEVNSEDYGYLLYWACGPILDKMSNPNIEEIKEQVRSGKYTFLFDESGNFITNSMQKL